MTKITVADFLVRKYKEGGKVPYLITLPDEDREKIFSSALSILKQVGISVYNEKTLNILGEAGARIEGSRAYIPSNLVESALETAPKEIQIYTRNGEPAMRLSARNCYFGNGTDCPNILDPFTGQKRKFLKTDVEKAGILCDALSNLDFTMPTGLVSDAPSPIADIHQFHAMMMNTTKPIIFTAYTPENHRDIIGIAAITVGGENELRNRPFVISYTQPISPLTYTREVCKKLTFCAENGIPVICTTAPMSGASAPVTIAGTVVLCLAECLGALVIGQLIRQGTPMITIGIPIVLNMRTAGISFDAPELQLMSSALFEMRQFIKLPMWGMAAASDSKIPDEQAAINAALSCTFQALGGANLIHGVGCLESGMATSFELIVMTNEIIGMLRRIMSGVRVDPEHLALEVIQEVGPGGGYLTHEHTLSHFKDLWESDLIDRTSYEAWSKNRDKSFGQRISEKIKSILKNHNLKPMSIEKSKAILEIIQIRESKL
ncbi:MAG: trimethylamine methyltransferase family protein [Spirochaetota bacterium]